MTLAVWEHRRAPHKNREFQLGFDDYYSERVKPQMKAVIERAVERAAAGFAQRIGVFAAEELYQGHIVPELNRFRSEGGKISDLKQTIETRCTDFRPAMNACIDQARLDFERSLAASVEHLVQDLDPALPPGGVTHSISFDGRNSEQITETVTPMGQSLADVINTAVSLSVGAAAAVISGGLGESLGIALLVELTAVSGPVGFVIGGVTALVVTAAGLWMGRERLTGAIESISIPGIALRGVLWSSRYERLLEEGATKTRESVEQHVKATMAPVVPDIAERIWAAIEKMWQTDQAAGGR